MRVFLAADWWFSFDEDAAWMSGRQEWRIPFGWQDGSVPEGSLVDPIAVFYEARQIFTISTNGDYKVEKLGHSSERKFDGRIFTDGTPGFFPSQTNQQEE